MYGYCAPEKPTEVVTIRVKATMAVPKPQLRWRASRRGAETMEKRRVHVDEKWQRINVYAREDIFQRRVKGPALVVDYGATTLIPGGWTFTADRFGNLVVSTVES